jgi:hypothetical protein
MKLYQSFEGQLVFSDDMCFAYDYKDEKVYTSRDILNCLDDSLSDFEYFTEENANDLNFYKLWCKQEGLKEGRFESLEKYMELVRG